MLKLFAALIFSLQAAIVDYGPPQDVIGNWKFDLYDSLNQQRGTPSNPFYVNEPLDITSGVSLVQILDSASQTTSQFSGQPNITGTPTPNSAAVMALGSVQTVMVIVTGTWTGTLQVEVSSDGGASYQPRSIHVLGSPVYASSITTNVVGSLNATAKTHVRVRAITAMAGSAQVKFVSSANQSNVYIGNSLKLVDGTSQVNPAQMTIRAASVPVVPTDTAIVVETRPWLSRVISGNGTTTIKAGAGVIHAVIVGAPTGGLFVAYDNTAGSGAALTAMYAGTPSGGLLTTSGYPSPESVGLDVAFTNGLTVVTTGSNQNSFTVIYR